MKHTTEQQIPPSSAAAKLLAAGLAAVLLPACDAFKVDVGTAEPIKLDPIKFEPIDVKMRIDVYQYTDDSEEKKQAIKNVQEAVENQRNRMEQVQILKSSRWAGENHLGLLSIHNKPAGKDGEWVQSVVEAENADRIFLMTHKSNESGTALAAIRRQQWQSRIQSAFKGELIEVEGDVPGTYRWVAKERDGDRRE